MTQATTTRPTEASASWELVLRAERKSPATIKVYTDGVQRYLTWCAARDVEPMDRTSLTLWIAGMLDAGKAPGTARMRLLAVRRFVAWQIVVGRLPADQFVGMKAPKVDEPVVDPLTDEELRALILACSGSDQGRVDEHLHHLRDEAIIRLMLETAIRAGEVVSLEIGDVDLTTGLVTIRRGKGGKGRVVPIGPATSTALDRYLTRRRHHRLADSADLWLGERGKCCGYDGLGRGPSATG